MGVSALLLFAHSTTGRQSHVTVRSRRLATSAAIKIVHACDLS